MADRFEGGVFIQSVRDMATELLHSQQAARQRAYQLAGTDNACNSPRYASLIRLTGAFALVRRQ